MTCIRGPGRSSDSSAPLSLLGSVRGSGGTPCALTAVSLVPAFLTSSRSPKQGHYCTCIPWASSDFFPFASQSCAKLGFSNTEDTLKGRLPPVSPLPSDRLSREPHSGREGPFAHWLGASQTTTNSLENQVRHVPKAAGFTHGHAVRTPKMFPKKNAH